MKKGVDWGLVFLHSFSCCCVRNLRNSLKIWTYIVQGHPRSSILVSMESVLCNFLLGINSNFGRRPISYSFRDIDALSFKNSLFFPPRRCLTPPSGETPCNINIIYTSLISTFCGLQFCRRHYGSIFSFSRCCRPKSRNHAKFDLIAVQGHPRSSILVSI